MMKNATTTSLFGATLTAMAVTCSTHAAEIMVNGDITTSTTWTANNTYNLQQQIYVRNGATLTIEAGTVIASTTNLGGSLAVVRGSKIFVNGTETDPVIMTSKADVATWTGGDPTTGNWRVAANEWGNLTIMGRAYISASCIATNTATCELNPDPNVAPMEGLVADSGGDLDVIYGGQNDGDDSGSISYLSIRYGGKVIGLGNELNGLSLGAVGRNTDIDHVEIMNNVDDGIEIWGGNVNLKYINIWNIGDDSLDIDQGYRGKIQFGLIVQGYSANAVQGSGVGDNCLEMDGAEDSDAQPVTTATMYNLTVIGQPVDGDDGTAWRDNARVQLRNCIFMDLGENLVQVENSDGCALTHGYGFNGTLSWLNTWTTSHTYSNGPAGVNLCPTPDQRYQAQSAGNAAIGQGFLSEITDSVFYRNNLPAAYSNADGANAVGVTIAGGSNPAKANVVATNMPIVALTRGAPIVPAGSGKTMVPVISIDPRAANNAITSVSAAPNDGFFSQAQYRGAFSTAASQNWLCGWTATDAFGFLVGNSCAAACPSDINGDNSVGVADLLTVIGAWGPCAAPPAACPSDINSDGVVGVADLLTVIAAWGPCP